MSESAGNVSSVTFDAGVTAIIYTGERQSAFLLVQIPIPSPSRRTPAAIDTHARPLDPFSEAGHDSSRASV
jgi:hypothetical protein